MTDFDLARAFAALDDESALRLVSLKIAAGLDPLAVVKELQTGMDFFSEQCRSGNIFISDLILAGDLFERCMKHLQPRLNGNPASENQPAMVIGTVKGDIHNLGKDIAVVLLKASGFKVHDLGINVQPEAFVQKLKETGAGLLGLSGLITPSFDSMKTTVQAVDSAGLRERVKIIIGGGAVSDLACRYCGADAFCTDAIQGLEWCKMAVSGLKP
ncbi:MAG TPA: cobalamin-dependent protein [Dehalococcoidales bacterium]|nr:cobalamin-dependent protein [Dehalococcoidales bacterium]